jgi:hypothetical protein
MLLANPCPPAGLPAGVSQWLICSRRRQGLASRRRRCPDGDERAASAAEQAPRRASTGTAVKTASRHIGQDYSYVPSELRRIAITVGVIVVMLVAAAIFLR